MWSCSTSKTFTDDIYYTSSKSVALNADTIKIVKDTIQKQQIIEEYIWFPTYYPRFDPWYTYQNPYYFGGFRTYWMYDNFYFGYNYWGYPYDNFWYYNYGYTGYSYFFNNIRHHNNRNEFYGRRQGITTMNFDTRKRHTNNESIVVRRHENREPIIRKENLPRQHPINNYIRPRTRNEMNGSNRVYEGTPNRNRTDNTTRPTTYRRNDTYNTQNNRVNTGTQTRERNTVTRQQNTTERRHESTQTNNQGTTQRRR